MRKIDCHILLDPARQDSGCAMLKQLQTEPINILALAARPGNITAARVEAIRCGSSPYVCWVDDDDEITPGIFSRLQTELDRRPDACGVFSSEVQIRDGIAQAISPTPLVPWSVEAMIDRHPFVHHVALFRRELAMRHLDEIAAFPNVGDQLLLWLLSRHGPWVHVPVVGYRWHRHAQQITALPEVGSELRRAREHFRSRVVVPA